MQLLRKVRHSRWGCGVIEFVHIFGFNRISSHHSAVHFLLGHCSAVLWKGYAFHTYILWKTPSVERWVLAWGWMDVQHMVNLEGTGVQIKAWSLFEAEACTIFSLRRLTILTTHMLTPLTTGILTTLMRQLTTLTTWVSWPLRCWPLWPLRYWPLWPLWSKSTSWPLNKDSNPPSSFPFPLSLLFNDRYNPVWWWCLKINPAGDCTCGIAQRSTRIVGGQEVEVDEWPWQVGVFL